MTPSWEDILIGFLAGLITWLMGYIQGRRDGFNSAVSDPRPKM